MYVMLWKSPMALQWTQFVSFSSLSLLPSHTLVQGYVSWTEDEPVRFLKLKTGALTASDHDLTQTCDSSSLCLSLRTAVSSPPYTFSTSRTNRQHCQYTSDDPYLEAVPVEGFAFIQYHLSSDPAGVAVSF